ncbi:DUF3290 family protein [uncultured Secundilactobacillus sp.]|uniref:DUF3290 family protein n=1 Tax=uncultured Secundilactobacillus sp. TaxID=2813935 RepID=UPI002596FD92|nr:DUF3290 family protein [uncultured Secundilactobacillus sp.]
MTFYTYKYLSNQNYSGTYLRIAIFSMLLIAAVIVLFLYYRHRSSVKYRDLAVIFLIGSLLMIGFQYQDYSFLKDSKNQSTAVVGVLREVASQNHVKVSHLQSDSTTATNGMLVRNIKSGQYYRVIFNSDQSGFITEKIQVQLNRNKINVVGES